MLLHWRKPIIPSPRSFYLLAACWLGVGLCTHFLISMLVLVCVGHTYTAVVSASPCAHLLCLENAFSLQLFTTSGYYSPLPFKQGTPNFDGRAYDKGTPSSLSLSINYSIQGLCVNYHLLQKKLLWWEMNVPWV